MRRFPQLAALLAAGTLAISGAACSGTSNPESPASTQDAAAVASPMDQDGGAEAASLTPDDLANASYVLPDGTTVQLTDGGYAERPDAEAATFVINVTLDEELTSFGDLDGDGVDDASVVLYNAPGGSGVFTFLAAVSNEGGAPNNVDTIDLGDRTAVETNVISDATVRLDVVAHGPEDPMCCPTEQRVWTYELREGELAQVSDELVGTVEPEAASGEAADDAAGGAPSSAVAAGGAPLDPDLVTIAAGALPSGQAVACEARPAVPWDSESAAAYMALPDHILCTWDGDAVDDDAPPRYAARQLLVLPVAAYADLYADQDMPAIEQQQALMTMLSIEQPEAPAAPLPMLPPFGNDRQAIAVQAAPLTFDGGAGYRYLAHYAGDATGPVLRNDVFYTFQGLTGDGAHWVSLVHPVTIASLPTDAASMGEAMRASIASDPDSYLAGMSDAIASLDPETDVEPALSALDGIIAGLSIGSRGGG